MSSSEPPSLKVTWWKTTSVDSYHTRDATKHWQADSFERSRPQASKTPKVQAHHGKTMRVEVFMILKQACPLE
jgi:hypothetical protein